MSSSPTRTRCIGILTSGGDCPGLNAAIRAITKAAIQDYGIKVIGIEDGFRGLVENRTRPLHFADMSGMLTLGGTILGTARDKPHKMRMGQKVLDMTETAVESARSNGLDCVVCLGGGGTQKNALHLSRAGLNVMTLPKTIDNDVGGTDVSFGFDTAVSIATHAIDRLHTTATSHNRIIVVETMGHKTGWLALASGVAGGADVILIPEVPYDIQAVGDFLLERQRRYGRKFSIVAVAEGAKSQDETESKKNPRGGPSSSKEASAGDFDDYHLVKESLASRLARQLQTLTRTDVRVTALGHVQRGGEPTARDRMLATRLGVKAAVELAAGRFNVMIAARVNRCVPVPLDQVAGVRNVVPLGHPWLKTARMVGTNLGIADADLKARIETASAAPSAG